VKNLVLIHLESISQMAFWQSSAELECLFGLMRRSRSFSNFQTASTSSVMSMSDLLHGDSSEMDHLPAFPRERISLPGSSKNFMTILRERGYRVHGVQYGSFCLGDAPNNFWGIWPVACGQFRWHNGREEMHGEIRDVLEKSVAAREPFALYFWNMNTHLRDEDPLKDADLPFHERFRAGYRLLDMSVKRLLDDLANLGLLQDTLVIAFGDHGDDLWRHGLYRGRSHIIDPYATTCWCPLFIYNNDSDVDIIRRLVSTIDLKKTLLHMLFPGKEPEAPATPFSGIDMLHEQRDIAFSQSMFALQNEHSDPLGAITKSYAVTDGDFRVMASTSTGIDDSGGMECYIEQWDHANTRNLLDFCTLDTDGRIVGFGSPETVHPHFRMTFTQGNINQMAGRYETLRSLLQTFIKRKESEALKRFIGDRHHVFPDECFTRKRLRQYDNASC
jgi:hypothetical protein